MGRSDCCERTTGIKEAIFVGEETGRGEVRAREYLICLLECRQYFVYCPGGMVFDGESIKSQKDEAISGFCPGGWQPGEFPFLIGVILILEQ